MKRINKSIFEGCFFLSDKIQVGSLETGAIQHGGCTKIDGKCYSNIDNGEYMTIYSNKKNTLSVLVPSTKDVNREMSKEEHLSYIKKYAGLIMDKFFGLGDFKSNTVEGSWYSDDLSEVVVEKSGMLSVELDDVTESDIKFFEKIATDIKEDLTQEAVSVFVNDSLAII